MSLWSSIGGIVGGAVGSLVGAPTVGAALGSAAGGAVAGGGGGAAAQHLWNVQTGSEFIQQLYNHALAGEYYYREWLADIAADAKGPSSQVGDGLHVYSTEKGEVALAQTLLKQFDTAHPPGTYTVPSPPPFTYPPTEPTGANPATANQVQPSAGSSVLQQIGGAITGAEAAAQQAAASAVVQQLATTPAGQQAAASLFPSTGTLLLLGVALVLGTLVVVAVVKR